jgi:hypothetical protein
VRIHTANDLAKAAEDSARGGFLLVARTALSTVIMAIVRAVHPVMAKLLLLLSVIDVIDVLVILIL